MSCPRATGPLCFGLSLLVPNRPLQHLRFFESVCTAKRKPPHSPSPRAPRRRYGAVAWLNLNIASSSNNSRVLRAAGHDAIPCYHQSASTVVCFARSSGASVVFVSEVQCRDRCGLHQYFQQQSMELIFVKGDLTNRDYRSTIPSNERATVLCSVMSAAVVGRHGKPLLVELHNGTRTQFVESLDRNGSFSRLGETDNRSPVEKLIAWLTRVYLPVGFPHTVSQDYLAYTTYRIAQNLASAIMTVLSTECLLYGLGLGGKVKATAAATAWVLKDGIGYLTKIWFGSVAGRQFDLDPKSWRISADIVEDIGGAMEVVMPLIRFPGSFLVIASLTNVLKGIAAMTGTATRHVIYRQLVAGGAENIGDVATKGESQGVTCKMLGLASGVAISSRLGQNYARLLLAYGICAVVHLAANWRSMECVQFSFFNKQRLAIALRRRFDGLAVPSPTEVSKFEKIVLPPWIGFQGGLVQMGCHVDAAFTSASEFRKSVALFKGERFLIGRNRGRLNVLLRKDATTEDSVRAYYVAQNCLCALDCCDKKDNGKLSRISSSTIDSTLKASVSAMRSDVKSFLLDCRANGWNTAQMLLVDSGVRGDW